MTIKDLIRLADGDLDKMILLGEVIPDKPDQVGWCNVDLLKQEESCIYLTQERRPLFHDN